MFVPVRAGSSIHPMSRPVSLASERVGGRLLSMANYTLLSIVTPRTTREDAHSCSYTVPKVWPSLGSAFVRARYCVTVKQCQVPRCKI